MVLIRDPLGTSMQAQEEARKSAVDIEYYSVIYDLLDKVGQGMTRHVCIEIIFASKILSSAHRLLASKASERLNQILSPTPDGQFVGSALVKQVRYNG